MTSSVTASVSDRNVQPTNLVGFTELDPMAQLYPFPAIRVTRIARDTDKKIGDFQLAADVARQLDEDQVGVLIANCETPDRMHERVLKLAETEYPAPWVEVLSSIDLARWWYGVQHRIKTRRIDAHSEANTYWRTGNCWFTRLERLEALSQELSRKNCPNCRLSLRESSDLSQSERRHCCGPIAGIILVDPMFQTQHARGLRGSNWTHNDRPELLNNFRKDLAEDGLRPPLLFMACPPAKSLNTLAAQRAYCLETLWYTDGSRLCVGTV